MIAIYQTDGHHLIDLSDFAPDVWVQLSNPTNDEIERVSTAFGVPEKALRAPLDVEESSYLEVNDGFLLFTIDIPKAIDRDGIEAFTTIPLCVIITETNVITSCIEPLSGFAKSIDRNLHEISTENRRRFVYRLLLIVTEVYQQRLRDIERERASMEERLDGRPDNNDLVRLHQLEISLVYFETSLRANKLTLERAQSSPQLKHSPNDHELLKEVSRETQQAIEMASLYRMVIQSTRDLFACVLNNGLNSVMKRLTSLTIILAIPTIIGGFYGMNVESSGIPLASYSFAFAAVCLITVSICAVVAFYLRRNNLL